MSERFPAPRKRFGQHFLTDPRILARLADLLGATREDTVIEIGPGRGALTAPLAARAGRLIAIEIDRDLASTLREAYSGNSRVTILERDVLAVALGEVAGGEFLLAGNVPYNITTPILFHALERPRPRRAVFLVQREVAERVVAEPGTDAYGALSVNVQAVAKAELVFRVAPGSFTPVPKVESAALRITPLESPVIGAEEEAPFREMVVGAFGFRRKQMGRVVRELWGCPPEEALRLLAEAGIDPRVRPEVLSPGAFAQLLRVRRRELARGQPADP